MVVDEAGGGLGGMEVGLCVRVQPRAEVLLGREVYQGILSGMDLLLFLNMGFKSFRITYSELCN